MKNQRLIFVALFGATLAAVSAPAAAQAPDGFYGGIAFRDRPAATAGVLMGRAALMPVAPPVEEAAVQQRVFGGYRWRNDLALEAGLARSESYALLPFVAGAAPGGVGLTFAKPQEAGARGAWNVDVVGSYTLLRSLALYGRVGYAQSELVAPAPTNLLTGDLRRPRDGVNYGLGMRYDINRALGLNLEYTRFGRFAFEGFGNTLPENDQVRLGVQFRF